VDGPRCSADAAHFIVQQLACCGLLPDDPPQWQSQRQAGYGRALQQLVEQGRAFACRCTRRDIETAWAAQGRVRERFQALVYPGTCRTTDHYPGYDPLASGPGPAWRLHTGATGRPLHWTDRRLGTQQQDVAAEVGDFVLKRADGLWAYQLAVVVDDAEQGVTHVVRGEDLADNTPRQILLQGALGLPTPAYLHTPLVNGPDGHKLSKQNGAQALDLADPAAAVQQAAAVLGLHLAPAPLADTLAAAVAAWPWHDAAPRAT
jgi:glutamyl-Q tRNA(Asp) synthetase